MSEPISEPIAMAPADYWRMKATHVEAVHADAEGARQIEQIKQRVQELAAKRAEVFTALSAIYGFSAEAPYRFDDVTCALVPIDTDTKQKETA